jgi:hypothetical protein
MLSVNATDIQVMYAPRSEQDRATLIVTLRPGHFPTPEAQLAINDFLDATKHLMGLTRGE